MKRLLAIVASPRRLGNGDLLCRALGARLHRTHELRLLRLADVRLSSCRACYKCLDDGVACPVDDDLPFVLDELCKADALVVAAPTYFLGAAAPLKLLLDRGLGFYARLDELWGTPAVGLAVAGIDGKEGAALRDVQTFLHGVFADVRAVETVVGDLPGMVMPEDGPPPVVERLAAALEGPAPPRRSGRCSLCAGDAFRLLDGATGRLRCLTCGNDGRIFADEGGFGVATERTGHQLFLSRDDVLAHRDWLRSRVAEYGDRRDELRIRLGPYRTVGTVVKPPA